MDSLSSNTVPAAARLLAAALIWLCCCAGELAAAGAVAVHAMVATDHELASEAACDVLREGGTAMDAAVTAAYVLGVVNPQSSGLGGGGFLVAYDAATGRTHALEYRDRAPSGTAELLASGRARPQLSGGLAASVPCEVVGLEAARKRFGRLPRARLLAPAIRLAREGFPTGRLLADMARAYSDQRSRGAELDRLLIGPDGRSMVRGETFWQPELASTLERIAREGAGAVMSGPVARAIALAVNAHGGRMSQSDFDAMAAHWVEPLAARYRDCQIFAMPPPASGAAVLMALRLFEPTPARTLGPYAPSRVAALASAIHHGVRAKRRHLGDPAFGPIPLELFLSGANPSVDSGTTRDDEEPEEEGHTTNVCVVDAIGNAVAMTMSLGAPFGSHILVPGTGIVLSNHIADFSPRPFEPNAYGTRYGPGNTIAPLKAAVSGSTPMLVFRGGRLALAIGGSGSSRIPPAVTQCLVNVVDHGIPPAQAVALPRFQVTGGSEKISVEPTFPAATRAALRLLGHTVREGVKRSSVTAIAVRPGLLLGASDPRKFGVPVGY